MRGDDLEMYRKFGPLRAVPTKLIEQIAKYVDWRIRNNTGDPTLDSVDSYLPESARGWNLLIQVLRMAGYWDDKEHAPQKPVMQMPTEWEKSVRRMWVTMRRVDSTIPDEHLDMMRDLLLQSFDPRES